MSVGKTADNGNVSIFTKYGVTIHKEEDVLITFQKKLIIIGRRYEQGRYRIPLTQDHGQWQPHIPTKAVRRQLQLVHSVYNLPPKEEAIKWMHAVCGYSVNSMWIKAIKAGNYVGWTMLTERNVARYYPNTNETPKGHVNQFKKNVRSTKPKRTPLEVPKTATLQGHKARDIYKNVYKVRNTVFSNQTWQFPTRSQ